MEQSAEHESQLYWFNYPYKGHEYSLEIQADSEEDARARIAALQNATYRDQLRVTFSTIPIVEASPESTPKRL